MPRNKYKDLEFSDKTSEEYKKAVEELIDIVSSVPDNTTYVLDDDIENFLTDTQIKSGTTLVPAYLFYYEFLVWQDVTKENGDQPLLGYEEFFNKVYKRFKSKRMKNGKVYRLNKDAFAKYDKVPKETLKEYKEFALSFSSRAMNHSSIIQNSRTEDGEENFFQEVQEESETE